MITGEVKNPTAVPNAMRQAAGQVNSALDRAVLSLAIKMTGLVKQKLSGDVLKVRTGRLRRLMHTHSWFCQPRS